jgi:hypothetical protein
MTVATAALAVPATVAFSAPPANAAPGLCIHVFVAQAGSLNHPLVDLHIILPSLTIANGPCPK